MYAPSTNLVVTEDSPMAPASPYARTKLMMEQILGDIAVAGGLRGVVLRYFNPIGANPDLSSGVHARVPSHVLGQLVMAANGMIEAFSLTGTDFETRDGTGLRDYVPVWDLARAHVAALERFDQIVDATVPCRAINLGTGKGVTVRELITAFEEVHNARVPVREEPRRPGDTAGACADISLARELLGWTCETSTAEAIRTALAWDARRQSVLGYR